MTTIHKRGEKLPAFKIGQSVDLYGMETWEYHGKDWWVRATTGYDRADTVDIMDDEEMAGQEFSYDYETNPQRTVKLLRVEKIVQDSILIVPIDRDVTAPLTDEEVSWLEGPRSEVDDTNIFRFYPVTPKTYAALIN